MFRIVARLNRRARRMPRRSPLTRVTPALSMATSVPVFEPELARDGDRPGREPHPYDVLPGGIRGGEEEGNDRPEAVLEFDGAGRLSLRNGQLCMGNLHALQGNVSEPPRELFRAGDNKD